MQTPAPQTQVPTPGPPAPTTDTPTHVPTPVPPTTLPPTIVPLDQIDGLAQQKGVSANQESIQVGLANAFTCEGGVPGLMLSSVTILLQQQTIYYYPKDDFHPGRSRIQAGGHNLLIGNPRVQLAMSKLVISSFCFVFVLVSTILIFLKFNFAMNIVVFGILDNKL